MRLLILGAGGHGHAVAEAAELRGTFSQIDFLDDAWPERRQAGHWNIVGELSQFASSSNGYDAAIPAVGNNELRTTLIAAIRSVGLALASVIHPTAFVSPSALLGEGCAIMAGAIVGPNARLGEGCIVNCHTTVDHDVVLDDLVHLGVGVHLAGGVKIGAASFLAAGCCAGYGSVLNSNTYAPPGTIFSSDPEPYRRSMVPRT